MTTQLAEKPTTDASNRGVWRIVFWAYPKIKVNAGAFPIGKNEWATNETFATEAEASMWSLDAHRQIINHEHGDFFGVTLEVIGPRYFP